MSESQSGLPSLPDLSTEDLKDLQKRAAKAKRHEEIQKRKQTPYTPTPHLPLTGSVVFGDPVKVSYEDDKLTHALGEFEDATHFLHRGEVIGVERQPSTPLPSDKRHRKPFMPAPSPLSGDKRMESSSHSAHRQENRGDTGQRGSFENRIKAHESSKTVSQDSNSANSGSVTSHRSEPTSAPHSAQGNLNHKQPSSSQPRVSKPEVLHSSKHVSSVTNREPVLESFNKQLSVSSKKELPTSVLSTPVLSSSNQSAEQNSRSSSEVRSVLSEKEANRTVNGVRKPRPHLRIPENVEDMLQEFDHPQPVTAINTPFKDVKTSKFPFKGLNESNDHAISKELFHKPSESGRTEAPQSSEPAPVVNSSHSSRPMEEIADKDPSSTSSSEASDDDDEDDGDDGSGSSSGSESEGDDHEGHDRTSEEQKVKSENSSQQASVVLPSVPRQTAPGGYRAPEKTQQMDTDGHKSSSDSSSSESGDSSDSGSDSESETEQDGAPARKWNQQQATPPEYGAEATSSPGSQSRRTWELENFLPKVNQSIIGINTKPPSYDAPASNKSEDRFDGDKRGADHISDENPPSNDQDVLSKRMSADEFSPPVPYDKVTVLSPIKSPIKRTYRHSSAAEKVIPKDESVSYSNKYDSIKQRERKSSQSMPSPDVSLSDKEKSRKSRARKPRTKPPKSQAYVSESDSEVDVLNTSQSPVRASPQTSRAEKSQITSTNLHNAECSNSVLTSPGRRDGQSDRHVKQQDRIKLKPDYSLGVPEKLNDCDISKPASKSSSRSIKDPSVDQILDSFPGATPLSPIPNNPNVDISPSSHERLVKAGLATTPIKPLNGNISWKNGKPSLPVRIDLKQLERVMCVNIQSPHFLSILSPEKLPKDISAKSPLPNHVNQPLKVLKNVRDHSLQSPNSAVNRTSGSGDSENAKSAYSNFNNSLLKSDISKSENRKQSIESAEHEGVPDFDSLPVQETAGPEHGSDDSSDSDSGSSSGSSDGISSDSGGDSDSDMEPDSKSTSHKSLSSVNGANTSNHSLNQSQPDIKKRKIDSSPVEDTKRRKTFPASPHTSPLKQTMPVHTSEPVTDSVTTSSIKTPPSRKRERHGSASSQRSTQSNLSHASTHSCASQPSKRPKVASTSPARAPPVLPANNPKDLKSVVTGDRGTSSSQNSSRCEPPQQNGITTPVRASKTGYSLIENRNENERLMTIDEYHNKARKYKYQADDMKPCLTKHILYIESALCFMQSGYASERSKKETDAAKMYKDTQVFVLYRYQQCEADARRNPSNPEKPELKLAVLCQRIQSYLYMKMYSLKKTETLKMKRVLEEQQSKGVIVASQPKPPSAPSPHQQNWNRSTGTPSPMSPQPSPASVCSVGSVGSDQTPSKMSNGTAGGQVPPGSVVVSQRVHSITQKYFSNTNFLIQAHHQWEQSDEQITDDIKDFFIALDHEVGHLTLHSSMQHVVRYVRLGLNRLHESTR